MKIWLAKDYLELSICRVWQLRNKGKMQESGQKEKSKKRGKERKMKPREHHIAYYSIFYGEKSTVSVVLFYSMFFHFIYWKL